MWHVKEINGESPQAYCDIFACVFVSGKRLLAESCWLDSACQHWVPALTSVTSGLALFLWECVEMHSVDYLAHPARRTSSVHIIHISSIQEPYCWCANTMEIAVQRDIYKERINNHSVGTKISWMSMLNFYQMKMLKCENCYFHISFTLVSHTSQKSNTNSFTAQVCCCDRHLFSTMDRPWTLITFISPQRSNNLHLDCWTTLPSDPVRLVEIKLFKIPV